MFRTKEMFRTKVVERITTHFVFNNFFFENPAVYERMFKNTVGRGGPQIYSMAHAHCMLYN
jgi:hypothetical protein